ncbi:MAG: CRISPR system precrRNA processing endoribonuclease RAMP protein Cas6 [Pseudomonadales bacterium]|nr:CRISPR system precrRNA processing endoribonuclease RAMP protein Cas6 [Pseudomonadales bacterium]
MEAHGHQSREHLLPITQLLPGETLSLGRYRFIFKVLSPLTLPVYSGGVLRGIWGNALRQITCITGKSECSGCMYGPECVYTRVFEPHTLPRLGEGLMSMKNIPVPYLVEPPPWGSTDYQVGEELVIDMVIMGKALQDLPVIILAWQRALLQGVGHQRDGKAELIAVSLELPSQSVERNHPDFARPQLTIPDIQVKERVALNFRTPLRIEQDKVPLWEKHLTAPLLVTSILRRISLILNAHMNLDLKVDLRAIIAAAGELEQQKKMVWKEWERYSARQQRAMTIGGVSGRWELRGNLDLLVGYLYLGQWLHAGKETSFGMGLYTLEGVDS